MLVWLIMIAAVMCAKKARAPRSSLVRTQDALSEAMRAGRHPRTPILIAVSGASEGSHGLQLCRFMIHKVIKFRPASVAFRKLGGICDMVQ